MVLLFLCHSLIAEKGRVTIAAVELNSVTFSTTSGSRSMAAVNRSQIRATVDSIMRIDVYFRVLVGSDLSAVELGIAFSNLVNGGILSDQLNREVSTTMAGQLSHCAAKKSNSTNWAVDSSTLQQCHILSI